VRLLVLPFIVLAAACIGEPLYVGGAGGAGLGGAGGGTTSVTSSATSSSTAATSSSSGATAVCGNWQLEAGEVCEDGNAFPGDGCDPSCQLEAFCGNGVIEPGEKCDGGACDATCEPTSESGCFGGVELGYGEHDYVAGPSIGMLGSCGAKLARFVGWLDTGPIPMRVALRFVGTGEQYKLSLGCTQQIVAGCGSTAVTAPLPPHSIVWLQAFTSLEGDARGVLLFPTRWGSWFNSGGDGMTYEGDPGVVWAWSSADSGVWQGTAQAAGVGYLVSPPVDLSGLDAAAAHFDTQFSPGASATGSVEFSVDGQTWVHGAEVPAGTTDHVEVLLDGAAGEPAVQVRFVYDATSTGTWNIRNLFIGPPVPP